MDENQNLLNSELEIDGTAHAFLMETAKWATFLSILGFIMSGFIVIGALSITATFNTLNDSLNASGTGAFIGAGTIIVFYLVGAIVNFFISLFLYRFASKMKQALNTTDQQTLNEAFSNQKKLYRMMGIIAIIYLTILALALIFGIGSAIMR